MANLEELMKILADEYGITTPEQLYEEVKKLGGIDITPLCAASRKKKESVLIDENGKA